MNILTLANDYATATRRTLTTVGRLSANHGSVYTRLQQGHDITTRR